MRKPAGAEYVEDKQARCGREYAGAGYVEDKQARCGREYAGRGQAASLLWTGVGCVGTCYAYPNAKSA
jgi:hypothetical protein